MESPSTFPGLEDLVDLGPRNQIDMRPTLLRVLTDLYLQRPAHTPEDERYYTELALRLIDATDLAARAALARRLASYPSAPRAVLDRLARDEIEVAAPIIEHSRCLTGCELDSIASERAGAHADLVAKRGCGLPPRAQAPSPPPSPAPSPAPSPTPSPTHGVAPAEAFELSELFHAAGAPERRLILINLDYAPIVPMQPSAFMQRADSWRLEAAALQRNTEAVMREIERMLGVSRVQARRIIDDESGEPMVVAAKAMDLPADVVQRMLLFMNPRIGHSVDRVYELAGLYGEITVTAARRLVAVWREADHSEKSTTHHKAIAWRTAAENARRALSEVSRRPAALPGHASARDHATTSRAAQAMTQSKAAAD